MNKIKSILLGLSMLAMPLSTQADNLNGIPDGWLDAKTSWHQGTQLQLTYYSCTPLGGGKALIAFVIQGHGDWKCFETYPDCSVAYLGEGRATQTAVMQFVIMDTVCGDYCGFEFFNAHGYSGPQL
jgi:hypothetical protein